MKPKNELEALEMSLDYWRHLPPTFTTDRRTGAGDGSVEPLCQLFASGDCAECPVKHFTGFAWCATTPGEAVDHELRKGNVAGARAAARQHEDLLREIIERNYGARASVHVAARAPAAPNAELIEELDRARASLSKAQAEILDLRETSLDLFLTLAEQAVLNKLAEAWNLFTALYAEHPQDGHDMMHAIHTAQNIVTGRPYQRRQRAEAARARKATDDELDDELDDEKK